MSSKSHLAPFSSVQEFFISWGLYPASEIPDDGDNTSIGINQKCREKLMTEAAGGFKSSRHGNYFVPFAHRFIQEISKGAFYLDIHSWKELEEAWEDFLAQLSALKG